MTQSKVAPRHGTVSEPASRAHIYLAEWQSAGLESGKFFPATQAGLADPFAADDVRNDSPPADGKIASAGQDFAAELDKPGSDWQKHSVAAGQQLTITWSFHAPHKTRRWNYFLTREGWDPNAPLSRAQFEPNPFHQVQNSGQPYWSADDLVPANPTRHTIELPQRQGYHVLLSVWEVADTPKGFYQVIDLSFTG
ncbi:MULTISPECIES: lytic polysaccharide monooxygenase auxiliary activity family 9 protein [Frankia]|uniref:Chitin-binding protein (Partial match) n=1 Tax=Frankia alni (strain DSM 45986 / CECT 9034 / ACN14a) TaxID=326424 RepID=Q0RUD7_FRAAA|nr:MULTISPECIES: lytic polysaccharide monooxygenase auxiliary activity family 9 protein [Frankia]CAJ58805.1 putative chitin-binding protein (partial match) [Frankia alni ACN14a]